MSGGALRVHPTILCTVVKVRPAALLWHLGSLDACARLSLLPEVCARLDCDRVRSVKPFASLTTGRCLLFDQDEH